MNKIIYLISVIYFIANTGIVFSQNQVQNRTFDNVQVILVDKEFNEEKRERKSYTNLNAVIHNKELFALRIINENISVVYRDSVTDVKRINRIELENDMITEVQPGAFGNLTRIFISLKNNLLQEINENVFSGVDGITGIDLEQNKISKIHPRAFANMKNLTVLILNHNQIATWSTEILKGSPVSNIFISNNLLEEIPLNAFEYLQEALPNRTMEFMDFTGNNIKIMKPGALKPIKKIKFLYLGKNNLNNITVQLFQDIESIGYVSLKQNKLNCLPKEYDTIMKIVKKIDLTGNPMRCDCIDDLSKWSSSHGNALILPQDPCVKVP